MSPRLSYFHQKNSRLHRHRHWFKMLGLLLETKSPRFEKIAIRLNVPSRRPFEKPLREVPSRSSFEKSLRFVPPALASFHPRHRAASGRAWWATSLAVRVRPCAGPTGAPRANSRKKLPLFNPVSHFTYIKLKGVYSDSQCGIRKVDVNYIDFPCPSPVSKLA